MEWAYFALGVLIYQVLRFLVVTINRAVIEHRQKRFLKFVSVTFPDKDQIAFISLDTSDKRALAKLEREIREQFDVHEDRRRDRRVDRSRSRKAPDDRRDSPR